MKALQRQALAYAAAGWPVFPCVPDGTPEAAGWKAPLTAHGFKDATTNPAIIRQWWERWPAANVSIATGAPGPDVLDVDVKPEGSGWAALNRVKEAGLLTGARAIVRTRSGGLHLYFDGTGQPSGRLVRHYLDFKAQGGYVLAPPSSVGGRAYELLESRAARGQVDWQAVRRILDPPRPPRRTGDSDGCGVAGLAEWVARQNRAHDRHGPLVWAAYRLLEKGQLDDAAAAELVSASVSAGHDERDAWTCVRSIQRKVGAR